GKLSYGPIGQPMPWPLATVSTASGDCGRCRVVEGGFGFRTASGYGLVWRVGFDVNSPTPNLFRMTVGPNFEGGEPRPIVANHSALYFDVASTADGVVVTTCSLDSQPEWIFLNSDLEVAGATKFAAQGASCQFDAPPVLWTGQRYLTSVSDARGLVIASLDKEGTLVGEHIVAKGVAEPVQARFSKNGDRVLFAFKPGPRGPLRSGVFDLQGMPLGEVQPLGEELDELSKFAIAIRRDGWWVVSDSGAGHETVGTLTAISRDGLALQATQKLGNLSLRAVKPSPYGGALLVGSWMEEGWFAHSFALMKLLDDDGQGVYSTEKDYSDAVGPWPADVVADPLRDLVIERRAVAGSAETTVVQEYGCLD
ncbi:MAG TPA: hypothetical protein VJV79_40690, partial [Polyangiaceae bacterium]|nr:hypothetical protein [Polyangiaceae bacterium]